MGKKLKPKREFVAEEDIVDMQGWTIPKGSRVGVFEEIDRPPSLGGGKTLVVRIDNGTGDWNLCPKTGIIVDE